MENQIADSIKGGWVPTKDFLSYQSKVIPFSGLSHLSHEAVGPNDLQGPSSTKVCVSLSLLWDIDMTQFVDYSLPLEGRGGLRA